MVGFSTLAPVLGFLLSVFTAVPAFAQDKIVLQLKWDHQAQFAGYCAALWQGFYADAGLDVEIRSAFQPGGRVLPATEVLEGRADFGIGAADLLLTINKGAPLIIASSVLQHSGFGIVTLEQSGISSPADLVGLRVATRESSVTRAELDAVLAAEGVDISLVKWVEVGAGEEAQLLSEGKIDAYMGFWPASRWRLLELGLSPRFLRPAMYGVDFYGDAIFTTFRLADENPELVRRFVAASLQGWHFHAEHPEEVADRITSELVRALPVEDLRGFNRAMATEISNLTNHPIIAFGHSNPDRWSNMFNILGSAGLVDGQFKYLDYVFDPGLRAAQLRDRLVTWLAIAFAAAVVASGLILAWSWLLRRQVAVQTSEIVESERRYALAVAGTDAGLWDWNLRSGEVFRSRRWHEMLGYARTEVESRVEAQADLLHPDDLTIAKSAMQSHLEERKPYDIEFRLRHKNGNYVWVQARGQAEWDRNNVPTRMAGSIIDITERINAVEKSQESNSRLNAVVTNAPIVLWSADRSGVIAMSEGKGLEALGLRPGQLVGESVFELYRDFPNVERLIHRALTGEELTGKIVKLGDIAFESFYRPLRNEDDEIVGVVGVGIDVTERFEARQALEESEQRFRRLFEDSEVAIFHQDFSAVFQALEDLRFGGVSDLREHLAKHEQAAWEIADLVKVLQVNEAAVKLFGAKDATAMVTEIASTFGRDAIEVFEEELFAIWDGAPEFRSEAKLRRLDGQEFSAIITFRIPQSDEETRSVPVNIIDIADRKRAEEEIRNNAAITANSSDMVALLDMDCIYLAVNDAYLRPFGKTRDQVVGHSAAELFGETFLAYPV